MPVSGKRLEEIKAIPEEEIDTSDIPELDEDFWNEAKLVIPKTHLRVEKDILEWFKAHGQNYQARMNTVLRDYVETHRAA